MSEHLQQPAPWAVLLEAPHSLAETPRRDEGWPVPTPLQQRRSPGSVEPATPRPHAVEKLREDGGGPRQPRRAPAVVPHYPQPIDKEVIFRG